jgi:hypothetical protein
MLSGKQGQIMELCGDELDRIVYEIVREADASGTAVTREQVAQLVLDYVSPRIVEYVVPSLERLFLAGMIDEDRDSTRGRPYIYYLPKGDSDDADRN